MTNRFLENILMMKILRTLTQKWTDMPAYKAHVIDSNGKFLVKPENQTIRQKQSYSKLDTLIFNLRKILERFPLGKKAIARYAAALLLIKENCDEDWTSIEPILIKYLQEHCEDIESLNSLLEDGLGASSSNVSGGIDIADSRLGKKKQNSDIVDHKPDDYHAGNPIFDVDNSSLMKSRMGKKPYLKYSSYTGKSEQGEKIRQYSRKNPKKSIILRNNGQMFFLRKKP